MFGGEIRVTDPRFRQTYIYTRPNSEHEKVLIEKGWINSKSFPVYYSTEDAFLAKETLESLGLVLPEWKTNHCYQVA